MQLSQIMRDIKAKNEFKSNFSSSVRRKVFALEQILNVIKSSSNLEPDKLGHSKEKAIKLFSKMKKLLKIVQTENLKAVTDNYDKRLPRLLNDLKIKSLLYQMEAMLVENLCSSTKNTSLRRTSSVKMQKLEKSKHNNYQATNFIHVFKSETKLDTDSTIFDDIDVYVKKYLKICSNRKVIEFETENIINDSVLKMASNILNLPKTKGYPSKSITRKVSKKSTVNSNYPFRTINQSTNTMDHKFKNCTTFLYYKQKENLNTNSLETTKDDDDDDDHDDENSQQTINNNEKISKLTNYSNSISNKVLKENTDIQFNQNSNNCSYVKNSFIEMFKTMSEKSKSNMYFIDTVTHSISEVHAYDCKASDQTISSNLSIAPTESSEILLDMFFNSPKLRRIYNAIQRSIKLYSGIDKPVLYFLLSTNEMFVPISQLTNQNSYELKLKVDEDKCYYNTLCIKKELFENRKNPSNEIKVKRMRTVSHSVIVPSLFYNFYYDYKRQRDTRILHIEKFCNCNISLCTKSAETTEKILTKPHLTISIIYDIVKGNDVGCLNMIKRLINIFTSQIKIIREVKLNVDGSFQETVFK